MSDTQSSPNCTLKAVSSPGEVTGNVDTWEKASPVPGEPMTMLRLPGEIRKLRSSITGWPVRVGSMLAAECGCVFTSC